MADLTLRAVHQKAHYLDELKPFIKWTSNKESIQLFKNGLLKRYGIQQNDTNQMTVMFFFYFLSNVIVRGIILLNAIPLNVVEPIFNLNFRGQPAVLYSFDNKNNLTVNVNLFVSTAARHFQWSDWEYLQVCWNNK
jgi:hypothetical protein